ncbi:MAG: cysteine hydrolase [Dehalococcoidia bacterium]|nr:cysteine hydrolase [Dehalococcoidia bacterium]
MSKDGKYVIVQAEPEPIEIDVLKTAVLIVDMQNAFVHRGGYLDLVGFDISATEKIIEPCQEIVYTAREKGIKIIYLQMGYSPDLSDSGGQNSPAWHKSQGLALIRQRPELKDKLYIYGTWGANIVEELEPQQGDIVIRKQKHDGFIGTNLDIVLATYGIKYLVFIGTATNICVESTLRHAFSLQYFPILVSDAVSQMGPSSTQEATIFNVRSTFGWVTTSEKLLNAIRLVESS